MTSRLTRSPLTARRAAGIIAFLTLLVTFAGGTAIWLLDHEEFPDFGTSLWWALQTVTSVGYGDVVPAHVSGRIIGAFLMLQGIGFLAVVVAAVTAALIEQARQRRAGATDPDLSSRLERIDARLVAIEQALADRGSSESRPDA